MPGATRDIRNLVVRYQSKGKVCDGSGSRSTKGDFPHWSPWKETPEGDMQMSTLNIHFCPCFHVLGCSPPKCGGFGSTHLKLQSGEWPVCARVHSSVCSCVCICAHAND